MSVLVVARWTVLEARRRRLVLAGVVGSDEALDVANSLG